MTIGPPDVLFGGIWIRAGVPINVDRADRAHFVERKFCEERPYPRASGSVSGQSFAFSRASFSAINSRISFDMFRSFNHCSLYNVTGKRPIP
jgi:hypothetical protein